MKQLNTNSQSANKKTFEILGQPVAKQRPRMALHRATPWPRQGSYLGYVRATEKLAQKENSGKPEHASRSAPRSGQCGESNL